MNKKVCVALIFFVQTNVIAKPPVELINQQIRRFRATGRLGSWADPEPLNEEHAR